VRWYPPPSSLSRSFSGAKKGELEGSVIVVDREFTTKIQLNNYGDLPDVYSHEVVLIFKFAHHQIFKLTKKLI